MNIFFNKEHSLHCALGEMHQGKFVPCFENPSRLENIIAVLEQQVSNTFHETTDYTMTPILAVHDEQYVQFLQNIYQQWQQAGNDGDVIPYLWPIPGLKRMDHDNLNAKVGSYAFSSDSPITKGTWQAVYSGAQSALSALNNVLVEQQRSAFSLSRPPGHHAHKANYGGYCFLNNAAICAQHALTMGAAKVAILDVDFHHGNGTQDIFYQRSDVLHVSIHGDPKTNFPYFLGYSDETGAGEGLGFNLNLPLADGADMPIWQAAFYKAKQAIIDFAADILIVPLGVDTYIDDPISKFTLTTKDYLTMGSLIESLALPSVFVMEGGYDVGPIGQNVSNVLLGFDESTRA